MSTAFKSLCSANVAAATALKGTPVAVFVGGTSGIGQGMAEAFGRYTNGKAHIIIVGRNKESADSILSRLPKPTSGNSTWSHEFIQCDITRMKNVQSAASQILAKHPKINFLVQSPGVMTTAGRDETEEGIDKKMALHYYARWKFIDGLLPALNKAKEEGEEAKALSVLSAGYGGEVDTNDLGLVKTFSLRNAALQVPTYNDLMNEEFSARNPGLTFIHAFPGGVKTGIFDNSPARILRITGAVMNSLFFLLRPWVVTQDECAEYMWSAVFNNTGGAFRTGSRGENLEKKRYFGNDEQRKKLWEHTVELTSVPS